MSKFSNFKLAKISKRLPVEKIVAFAILIVIFGLFLWQLPAITSFLDGLGSNSVDSKYSTLSLVSGVSLVYKNGNDSFTFSYRLSSADVSGLFYVSKNIVQTRSFPAVAGAVFSDLGLEMKVSSVTSELLVLLVKPLPN